MHRKYHPAHSPVSCSAVSRYGYFRPRGSRCCWFLRTEAAPPQPDPEMGVDPDGPHSPQNSIVDVSADGPPAPRATEELTSMPLSPHEEPLSAYEQKVLAAFEEEFRVEDPELDAVLSRTPPSPSTAPGFPLPIRHVLVLLAVLTGLTAVVALTAGQLVRRSVDPVRRPRPNLPRRWSRGNTSPRRGAHYRPRPSTALRSSPSS